MKMNSNAYVPAPLWRRLAAMAYDSILVLAIWMVVAFVVLSLFGVENARTVEGEAVTLDPLYRYVLFSAMVASAWAFFAWFWIHSGQTLGMQAWRVRVENADGSTISAGQAVVRFTAAIVSALLLGGGYWMMLFNGKRETLHDKLSHSVVTLVPLMKEMKEMKEMKDSR